MSKPLRLISPGMTPPMPVLERTLADGWRRRCSPRCWPPATDATAPPAIEAPPAAVELLPP